MATLSKQAQPTGKETDLFYEDRFWEQYVGKNLVSDPVTAIVELVANCWDAGATRVEVTWPDQELKTLRVGDNGEGMTRNEFYRRWGGMSYDRIRHQGSTVDVLVGESVRTRKVFGRNGIGRFAGFCFAAQYTVTTTKSGKRHRFLVRKGRKQPLEFQTLGSTDASGKGTEIEVEATSVSFLPAETIRTELGRRFLTDPSFQVLVNGVKIAFEDIEDKGLETMTVEVPDLNLNIIVKIIDAKRTDRTGKQHGVAWHVLNRLVGDCCWKDPEQRSLLDGRRVEAKRFTFIVEADVLHEAGAVKPDWSGFEEDNPTYQTINAAVQSAITKRLLEVTKEKRDETTNNVRRAFSHQVRQMSLIKREQWNTFVEKVAEECPRLTENELKSVSGILANMEAASSQYGLLQKLHDMSPDQIDDLHRLLDEWTLDMAKLVLDEIRDRMKLIEELRIKTGRESTLEVQELQPLFRQGLWIFGPEFETIHYTSNEGMTTVIRELFGRNDVRGTRNRPDFAILPDSTAGFYTYPEYDDQGGEVGPAKLVIVELKAPDVPIGSKEKDQCWQYLSELYTKGMITERTEVQCFVLGRTIRQVDRSERTEMGGRVKIRPLDFEWVLQRADSRLLKLREKIKNAPFLREAELDKFCAELDMPEGELPLGDQEVAA
jgi:hypothetical protein